MLWSGHIWRLSGGFFHHSRSGLGFVGSRMTAGYGQDSGRRGSQFSGSWHFR